MNWTYLTNESNLEDIKARSQITPQVIFKHSIRCNISSMAKSRLERADQPEGISFYLLDLIQFRNLSNQVANEFQVHHESPQILLIKKGECVFTESHSGICMDDIVTEAASLN